MQRCIAILCLTAACLILNDAQAVRGDVILEGQKSVRNTFSVDFGPWADFVPKTVLIAKGDTLEGLAKKHLKDPKRSQEIAAVNPGVEPKKLKIGAKLKIPALKKPKAGQEPPSFFGIRRMHGRFHEIHPGESYSPGRYGHHVLAVPSEKLSEFKKLYSTPKTQRVLGDHKRDNLQDWIARSKIIHFDNTIDESDPAEHIHTVLELQSLAKKDLVLKKGKIQRFNEDGKILTHSGPPASRRALFAGLSAMGLAGLAVTMLRRRRTLRA